MTIEQILNQLVKSNAPFLDTRQVEADMDCDSECSSITVDPHLLDALSSVLRYAADCSPIGSRISVSAHSTSHGIEIEIADSSNLSADSARAGSFVIAKAEKDLQDTGVAMSLLNCPQGGVAYSILLPKALRAAA